MPNRSEVSERERRHALRTPLGHVIGYTELLLEELDEKSKDEIRQELRKVRSAARELLDLLNDQAQQRAAEPGIHTMEPFADRENDGTGSILVVDDDMNNRMLMVRVLEKRGYKIKEAGNGEEALALIDAEDFDLILCDVMMPKIDGVEVLTNLQKTYGQTLPVIVISAMDQLDTVVECLDLGAADFIQKPFEPAILVARVRAAIKRKRMLELPSD